MDIADLTREVEDLRQQLSGLAQDVAKLSEERKQEKVEARPQAAQTKVDDILRPLAEKSNPVEARRGAVLYGGLVTGDGEGTMQWSGLETLDRVLACPPGRAARFSAPFTSEQRIGILRALFPNPKGIRDLEEATGFTSAQIYHHMKDLLLLEFVTLDARNTYTLSSKGAIVLLTLLALASHFGSVTPQDLSRVIQEG